VGRCCFCNCVIVELGVSVYAVETGDDRQQLWSGVVAAVIATASLAAALRDRQQQQRQQQQQPSAEDGQRCCLQPHEEQQELPHEEGRRKSAALQIACSYKRYRARRRYRALAELLIRVSKRTISKHSELDWLTTRWKTSCPGFSPFAV